MVSINGGTMPSAAPANSTTAHCHTEGEMLGDIEPLPSSQDPPDSNTAVNVAKLATPCNLEAPPISINPLHCWKVDDVKKSLPPTTPPTTPCPWPSNLHLQAPQLALSHKQKVDVGDGPSSPVAASSSTKALQLEDIAPIQSLTSMISTSFSPNTAGAAIQQGSNPSGQLKGYAMQIDGAMATDYEFRFLSVKIM